ncbi:MAG: alpha/beta fold hydrolase [Cyanophyceae cyanobacterium]
MTTTEQVIEVGALQWFYREATPNYESEKPPVLLLHGLPSHSYIWRGLLPELAEYGLRAIAPDWIGFGFSAKPDSRDFAYTPDAFEEALANFLQALNLTKFSLIVQGFLGSVGLQYALEHQEQIERLVILNTPLSKAAKLPWQMRQWGLPFIGDMLTQDPLLVDRTLEGGSGFVIADENLAAYRQPFLKSSAAGRALKATVKNLKLPEAMAKLASQSWENPTLLVWGMADPWLTPDEATRMASSYLQVELLKLEEAKHYLQEHWLKEISPAIINFLRRQVL